VLSIKDFFLKKNENNLKLLNGIGNLFNKKKIMLLKETEKVKIIKI